MPERQYINDMIAAAWALWLPLLQLSAQRGFYAPDVDAKRKSKVQLN
ncbi:hypothetical protein [Rhizobium leguminosarum]|nr:hypothetical protein [Rhizobium leguminosarum]